MPQSQKPHNACAPWQGVHTSSPLRRRFSAEQARAQPAQRQGCAPPQNSGWASGSLSRVPTGRAPWGPILPGRDYWPSLMAFLLLAVPLKSRHLQRLVYQHSLQPMDLSLHRNRMRRMRKFTSDKDPAQVPQFSADLLSIDSNQFITRGQRGFLLFRPALRRVWRRWLSTRGAHQWPAPGSIAWCLSHKAQEKPYAGFPEWNLIFIKEGHTFGPGSIIVTAVTKWVLLRKQIRNREVFEVPTFHPSTMIQANPEDLTMIYQWFLV